jgi:DNA polymerase (family 10)
MEYFPMQNAELAKFFWEIARWLELKGENPFKVRAYETAARTIEGIAEPLSKFPDLKSLEKIPGVGKSIAEKIIEIINTGTCQFLKDLQSQFPPGMLELLKVQGLGPKKAARLYQELGISDIQSLKQAASSAQIRNLAGFGAKEEANILKGIELLLSASGRITLGTALPLAEQIMAQLRANPAVLALSEAGSLRRRRDTIGDIDILASSLRAIEVIEHFSHLPEVKEIIAKGETKCSIRTAGNLQVDLRVVAPESFGAALQYFTGSKEHNILLRRLSEAQALKINEYGVFKMPEEEKKGGEKEEEIYKVLGLDWIPPEIREGSDELLLAGQHRLPKLVELTNIKGDLHVHSLWSDGIDSIETIADKALSLGYEYVAITDHSVSLHVARGLSLERVLGKKAQIEELQKLPKYKRLKILMGTEVDILPDGALDYPEEVLQHFEVVIGAVHSHFKQDAATMTARLLAAMQNPYLRFISHPSGRLIGQREELNIAWDVFLPAAAKAGVVLEINSFPDRLDLRDIYCRRFKGLGGKLAVNTDAHSASQMDYMGFGVSVARRGWLEGRDIVNTYSWKEFERWLLSPKDQKNES